MKPRTMHTNPLVFPTSILIMRVHGYIRTYDKGYKPSAKGRALKRRNAGRIGTRKAAWKR